MVEAARDGRSPTVVVVVELLQLSDESGLAGEGTLSTVGGRVGARLLEAECAGGRVRLFPASLTISQKLFNQTGEAERSLINQGKPTVVTAY